MSKLDKPVAKADLVEAAKTIETLTGARAPLTLMTRKEKREQAARVERFLALPPQLQEGILRYGENMRDKYGA